MNYMNYMNYKNLNYNYNYKWKDQNYINIANHALILN